MNRLVPGVIYKQGERSTPLSDNPFYCRKCNLQSGALASTSSPLSVLPGSQDRILFELQQAQGPVSCIAFRSDDASMPYLVSGAPTGQAAETMRCDLPDG